MDLGFGQLRAGTEDVEVAALVRLRDVLREDRAVTARGARRRRAVCGAARDKHVVGDVEVELSPA